MIADGMTDAMAVLKGLINAERNGPRTLAGWLARQDLHELATAAHQRQEWFLPRVYEEQERLATARASA